MQKITLHLDLPELTQAERDAVREEIGQGLVRVFPKGGWSWLCSFGDEPTEDMARGLLAGWARPGPGNGRGQGEEGKDGG